jgi:hypothetical protein
MMGEWARGGALNNRVRRLLGSTLTKRRDAQFTAVATVADRLSLSWAQGKKAVSTQAGVPPGRWRYRRKAGASAIACESDGNRSIPLVPGDYWRKPVEARN